ncbi:hypothetical protein BDW71DRAFT_193744 [Aspergillus fruticulosus]
MPGSHPSINLEPYKDEITGLYLNNTVPNRITEYLADSYGISTTPHTIEARLWRWGVLHAQIMELLKVLQLDGFKIEALILKYLRHKLGLFCCTTNSMASQAQYRDCLYLLCLNNLQHYYSTYVVPGPDFIWSIDGYLKLVLYRFEIYAAIDAYSHYIIWIYMGTSSHTAISILWNFFQALQEKGVFSKDSLANQITLYTVYILVLQLEINSFKSRPNTIPSKLFMNYNYPPEGTSNHGLEFDIDLFSLLQNDVQDWNPDKYLLESTYNWMLVQLKELGFNPHNPPKDAGNDILTPYHTIYFDLQARIRAHIQHGNQPELGLLEQLVGGFDWEPMSTQEIPEVELEYD